MKSSNEILSKDERDDIFFTFFGDVLDKTDFANDELSKEHKEWKTKKAKENNEKKRVHSNTEDFIGF